jgi:replicative DNA helicase
MSEQDTLSNLDAERGVLGACLIDNDRIPEVAAILGPDDFFRDSHRAVYRTILALFDKGTAVDAISLADAMGTSYGPMGGDDLLMDLTAVPHAANAAYHARIVKERSLVRGLLSIAHEVEKKSAERMSTAGDLIGHAQGRMMDLMTSGVKSRVKGPSELADELRARLLERRNGGAGGLGTGISDLNDAIGLMEPGNMIVIGARPSQGKTALILNICTHLSIKCEVPTLFLSLEMLTGELMDRVAANLADVPLGSIRSGKLGDDEFGRCVEATDAIEASCLHIDDGRGMTLSQVCATARMYRARHGIEMICLDYIAKVREETAKGEGRWEVVKRISNRLKDLAGELKIPVIVAAQLNRQAGSDRPSMGQLRESGDIEADADIVALLHRPDRYDPNDRPGQIEVVVDKARNAATGIANLAFDGVHQRITNLAFPRLREAAY